MKGFFSSVRETARSALKGKIPAENEQFEKNFQIIIELRKELVAIEQGVRKWIASSRELAKSAKLLGKTVHTPDALLEQYSTEMESLLDMPTTSILRTLLRKTELLDNLIRQRNLLKELRTSKELYEKKLFQLEEADRQRQAKKAPVVKDFDVQVNQVKQKIASWTEKYECGLIEVSASMDHILTECGTERGPKLVAPELASFRRNQFQFFLLCQKTIAGEMEEMNSSDLETQWKAFQRKNSTQVANARVNKREDEDGESHVKWNADKLVTEDANVQQQQQQQQQQQIQQSKHSILGEEEGPLD